MKSSLKKVSKKCGGTGKKRVKVKSACERKSLRRSLSKRKSNKTRSLKKKVKRVGKKRASKRVKKQKGGYMLPAEYFGGDSKRYFEDPFVNKGASHEQHGKYKPQSHGMAFDDASHGPNLFPNNMSSKQPKK